METSNANGNNSDLKEFFIAHLKKLYWAEKELVDTLPDMADAATTSELREAFTNHLEQTKEHVYRLEQVFSIVGEEPDSDKCKVMASITDAGDKTMSETEDGTALRDVGLIFGGQMAEHYEIASYGSMIELAKVLGYDDAANLFSQTLAEEKEADQLLTQIAEQNVNYQASHETNEA